MKLSRTDISSPGGGGSNSVLTTFDAVSKCQSVVVFAENGATPALHGGDSGFGGSGRRNMDGAGQEFTTLKQNISVSTTVCKNMYLHHPRF